jgi:phosphopantothenoylcysteine decarboxylase/phosphopantothenate--cysteine ligase
MGFALAEACAYKGADVTLVTGPVALDINVPQIRRINIRTADEMFNKVTELVNDVDIVFMAAAVADYKPAHPSESKLKKKEEDLNIALLRNKDILKSVGETRKDDQVIVGFALETDDELDNARKKLDEKNLDHIILNSLQDEGAGFGVDTNIVTIINKDGTLWKSDKKHKSEIAADIVNYVIEKNSLTS